MRKTLTRRQAYYAQALGVGADIILHAQQLIRAEELSLTVEVEVLTEHGVLP